MFEEAECEAVILVDANNAFNSLNRKVALHNIQIICPQFSTILELLSQEGTTQGDNLAMSSYALNTVLLQQSLRRIPSVKQVWLADDATGAGTIENLKLWWDLVIAEGRKTGYDVNEDKS